MYKKFIITFVLCMGIFGTCAFATTVTPQDVLNKLTTTEIDNIKKNYNGPYIYGTTSTNIYIMFAPTGATTLTYNNNYGNIYFDKGSSHYIVDYNISTGKYSATSLTTTDGWGGTNLFSKRLGDLGSSSSSVSVSNASVTVKTLTFPQAQLLKGVTIQQALSNLTTDFGRQLKIILIVGVTILAILLGVSLIPRLVHLFL